MPDYRVYQDKYAQGYIGILKKNKKYKQYLNVILRPGGIRPQRKIVQDALKSDSMYSDQGSRKHTFITSKAVRARNVGSQGGSQVVANRASNQLPPPQYPQGKAKKLRGAVS
jgi:hypothetical protein